MATTFKGKTVFKIVSQNVDNPNLQSSCDGVTGLDVEVFHVGHISIV